VLRSRWASLSGSWQDFVRTKFEREYWRDFESTVPSALESLKRATEEVDRIVREAEGLG